MCQFARSYPLNVLRSFIDTDVRLSVPNIQNVTNEVLKLNDGQFTQELTAQIQNVEKTVSVIYRMGIREIENFLTTPVSKINWTSQMVILDCSLPLGIRYWYMKQFLSKVKVFWNKICTFATQMIEP